MKRPISRHDQEGDPRSGTGSGYSDGRRTEPADREPGGHWSNGRAVSDPPTDAEIRSALRLSLLAKHVEDVDTVIINELGLCRGRVRVDVAVVNGTLHGYEIKSDRDSLRRLGGQIEFYGKILDRVTLVVGRRHLARAIEMVPIWWGIVQIQVCATSLRFKTLRRSRKNPRRDPRSLVELLWLDDAVALLEERGAAKGIRGKPRRVVWDRFCQHFAENEIAETVRSHIKARVIPQAPPPPW